MGRKHDRTLAAIFAEPTRANVRWDDFVALVESRGGTVKGKGGSMFGCTLGGHQQVLHRPHPGNVMDKPGVRAARRFLRSAGIEP